MAASPLTGEGKLAPVCYAASGCSGPAPVCYAASGCSGQNVLVRLIVQYSVNRSNTYTRFAFVRAPRASANPSTIEGKPSPVSNAGCSGQYVLEQLVLEEYVRSASRGKLKY